MTSSGDIYNVEYEYTLNGQSCHTTWCGRAASSEDAIAKSTEWYKFDAAGAVVTNVKATVFKPKYRGEE